MGKKKQGLRKFIIFLFISSFTLIVKGQYPFEKYPVINDKAINNWKIYNRLDTKNKIDYILNIPKFYNNQDTLTIQITKYFISKENVVLRVFHNKKQIQKRYLILEFALGILETPDSAFIADYNSDGLLDLKFYIPNKTGCGGFNTYAQVFYLFQDKAGTFKLISFTDYFKDFIYRKERDFNGNGIYELITQTFIYIGKHSYWVFNLYNYTINGLINVNKKTDYPIITKTNYKITDKISKNKIKEFSRKLPNDYKFYK